MGCMHDYTYCTKSSWSPTTGAGMVQEGPPHVMQEADFHIPAPLPPPLLLLPVQYCMRDPSPVSSVSRAGAGNP